MVKSAYRLKEFPDVLNIAQVSTLLQISEKTVYKLIRQKELSHIKIGRIYRVYKADLIRICQVVQQTK